MIFGVANKRSIAWACAEAYSMINFLILSNSIALAPSEAIKAKFICHFREAFMKLFME